MADVLLRKAQAGLLLVSMDAVKHSSRAGGMKQRGGLVFTRNGIVREEAERGMTYRVCLYFRGAGSRRILLPNVLVTFQN